MTVAATYSWDPTATAVVRQALRMAGLLGLGDEPTPAEVAAGAEMLNTRLKAWQAAQRLLSHVDKEEELTLVSGTAAYTITDDTIDVELPAMAVSATDSDVEYQVDRMTLDEYVALSNKSQAGIPNLILVERLKGSVQLTLYPVPDGNVTKLKYTRRRLIRDMTSASTVDLAARHIRAVILMVAIDMAESFNKSDDKIARLESRLANAMAEVKRDSQEKGNLHMRMGRW